MDTLLCEACRLSSDTLDKTLEETDVCSYCWLVELQQASNNDLFEHTAKRALKMNVSLLDFLLTYGLYSEAGY